MMQKIFPLLLVLCFPAFLWGANDWQQHVDYQITIDLDVKKNTFTGTQTLVYTNNSPDELDQVFYHLYFNAFQPGSMMDVRSQSLPDPDPRVKDRIGKLSAKGIGRLTVTDLKQDGRDASFEHKGTILQVKLGEPIKPGQKVTLALAFEGQVPEQIRRSGRDNEEGIRFSMSQWYPKICEYDHMGWHANPYIGREFHGVWGDFDVKIKLDPSYVVAATGVLQNPAEIGKGYTSTTVEVAGKNSLEWHFKAENVHDFVWTADPDYKHVVHTAPGAPELHFFYQAGEKTKEWENLPEYVAKAFQIMNKRVGVYPYPVYSVIQGGDGGMEYPMATLITGHRRLGSLIGVTVHEMIHSWFQGVLATNEALYPWMDEGMTSYYTHEVVAELLDNKDPQMGSYQSYFGLIDAGIQEPLTVHADHYNTNYAYSVNAYSKGTVLCHQLSYVIGQEAFDQGIQDYFERFKFKHPDALDLRRCMERASGLELDWYFEYFMHTTHTIDYKIEEVKKKGGKATTVSLKRKGLMPMPIELVVTEVSGKKSLYYIPLGIMWGEKKAEGSMPRTVMTAWRWTDLDYELEIPIPLKDIAQIDIDPSQRLADHRPKGNSWTNE